MASTFSADLEKALVKLQQCHNSTIYTKPKVFPHHIRVVGSNNKKFYFNYDDVLLYLQETYTTDLYSVAPRGKYVLFEVLRPDVTKIIKIKNTQYKITTAFKQTKLIITNIPHEISTNTLNDLVESFGTISHSRRNEQIGRRHRAVFFFSSIHPEAKSIENIPLNESTSLRLLFVDPILKPKKIISKTTNPIPNSFTSTSIVNSRENSPISNSQSCTKTKKKSYFIQKKFTKILNKINKQEDLSGSRLLENQLTKTINKETGSYLAPAPPQHLLMPNVQGTRGKGARQDIAPQGDAQTVLIINKF